MSFPGGPSGSRVERCFSMCLLTEWKEEEIPGIQEVQKWGWSPPIRLKVCHKRCCASWRNTTSVLPTDLRSAPVTIWNTSHNQSLTRANMWHLGFRGNQLVTILRVFSSCHNMLSLLWEMSDPYGEDKEGKEGLGARAETNVSSNMSCVSLCHPTMSLYFNGMYRFESSTDPPWNRGVMVQGAEGVSSKSQNVSSVSRDKALPWGHTGNSI